jgi:hypothetical protein
MIQGRWRRRAMYAASELTPCITGAPLAPIDSYIHSGGRSVRGICDKPTKEMGRILADGVCVVIIFLNKIVEE